MQFVPVEPENARVPSFLHLLLAPEDNAKTGWMDGCMHGMESLLLLGFCVLLVGCELGNSEIPLPSPPQQHLLFFISLSVLWWVFSVDKTSHAKAIPDGSENTPQPRHDNVTNALSVCRPASLPALPACSPACLQGTRYGHACMLYYAMLC